MKTSLQFRVARHIAEASAPCSNAQIAKALRISAEAAGASARRIAREYGCVKNVGHSGHGGVGIALWQAVPGVGGPPPHMSGKPSGRKARGAVSVPAGQPRPECGLPAMPPCALEVLWPDPMLSGR